MLGGTPGLELVGLEDSTAPYKNAKRINPVELGQVGHLRRLKNTTKQGTWSTPPTWPTSFVMLGGTPGLELVGLEDSTAPYKPAKRMNLANSANFFRDL